MKPSLLFLLGALTGLWFTPAVAREVAESALPAPRLDAPGPARTDGPVIKLALLLDTSNSMDGLINQARTRLWQVVNELGRAHVAGQRPQLQVALLQYGNSGLPAAKDYVELRCAFTTDLDLLSEQLFGLSTNGGSEFCGAVLREATRQLDWGHEGDSPILRVIVIAGNEPFNQGSTPYPASIATAVGLDIRVNTIFCGDRAEGIRTLWADGARQGRGHYAAIDSNQVLPEISTPFDETIQRLNETLNGTYLGFGRAGADGARRQAVQDEANRALSPSASIERVRAKASVQYETAHWDLVSAVAEETVELEAIPDADLPETLRGRSVEEKEARLAALQAERAAVQAQIQELTQKRDAYLAKLPAANPAAADDLDNALLAALHAQALALGFAFDE